MKKTTTVSVAHVGWRNQWVDRSRRQFVCQWPGVEELLDSQATFAHDYIDLADGRDFLVEKRPYDIVVLHHVYAVKHQFQGGPLDSYTAISPLHSPETWRHRLKMTQAALLFTFGYHNGVEVDSEYLGRIEGYEIIASRFPENFDVYRRIVVAS